MKIIRFLLRIIVAPAALGMTVCLIPLALLLFVTGDYHNGGIFLLLALLISPYGLPMIAEWLWKRMADICGVMWRLVFG